MYGSVVRMLTGRNLIENTINVPATIDLGATAPDPKHAFFSPQRTIYPQSKVIVRRVGVFCNFADGLVLRNSAGYYALDIVCMATKRTKVEDGSSVETITPNRTLTGNGTKFLSGGQFTGGTDGTFIEFGSGLFNQVRTIASDTELEMHSLAESTGTFSIPAGGFSIVTDAGSKATVELNNIRTLNHMYEVNELLDPFDGITLDNLATGVMLYASLDRTVSAPFDTHSISPDFNGDTASIDVIAEFEFTPLRLS